MKILLLAIGTRGDMNPFLAVGEMLQEQGHHVTCAFPEQFGVLAAESRLEFASLGSAYIESLESDLGKAAMGAAGAGWRQFAANLKLGAQQNEINKAMLFAQHDIVTHLSPDRVLYNGKAAYPILWGLFHPGQHILLCAAPYMHAVHDHTHLILNKDWGPRLNQLTYDFFDFSTALTALITNRWLKLGNGITYQKIRRSLAANKAIYTISPTLFPRPAYWPENLQVLGYHERSKTARWNPDAALLNFLETHAENRILLVTFGSMATPDPVGKTSIILEILARHQIPAIINSAAGGLIRPAGPTPPHIHFVDYIPYDWILPRIYGIVHHGGSGTTHLGLKYGCPALILPHILDQFAWNDLVASQGVGPKGIKINRLTTQALEPRLLALWKDPAYKQQAQLLSAQIAEEDLTSALYQAIIS